MTNFKLQSYIPKQDIKVRPSAIVKELYNLLDMEIEDNSFEDITSKNNLRYINKLYKKMKELLVNYHFWYNVSSYNFCCYQFRNPKNKNDIGKICGRRINTKNSYDCKSNKFFCSEHDRNHRKYHSKPIKIKENEILCNHINKDGSNCKYSSKLNGLCTKHHKYIYKVDKNEIYNKIMFYKEYTNIDLELNLFYNIEIENSVQNQDTISKLGNNFKKKDTKKIRQVSYQNYKIIKKVDIDKININNTNSNITNIIKNTKNAKNLENYCISNYINKVHNKLQKLNTKITENDRIIENDNKYYTNIEYKKPVIPLHNIYHLYTPSTIDNKLMNQLQHNSQIDSQGNSPFYKI